MHDDNYSYESGKMMKSDNSIVNKADILVALQNLFKSSLGRNSGAYISNTATHRPPSGKVIIGIIPTSEITLTTIGNIPVTGITVPQGVPVYGEYTEVTLGTGTAYIYYGVV